MRRLVVICIQIVCVSVHYSSAIFIAHHVRVIFLIQQAVDRSEIIVLLRQKLNTKKILIFY